MTQPYRQDLNWLVTDFATRVEDVAHAVVVSADGVPLALSEGISESAVGQLAAIVSGLASLVLGAARVLGGGAPTQALVEMESGLMFVKTISDGSNLAVLAAPECDTRQVSFEMTRLVGAVGDLLTPAAREELASRASGYQAARRYPDPGTGARRRGTPAAVTPAMGRDLDRGSA